MTTGDTDTGHRRPPFLDLDPPHWAAQGLAYLLLALFLVAAIAAVWLRFPEIVSGTFVVAPVTGSDPVRTPRRGVVLEVRVREGQEVGEREAIAVIGSEESGDRSADLGTLETQVRGAAEALANARGKYDGERKADAAEERGLHDRIEDLGRRTALKEQQVALKTQVVDGRRRLHEQGLTSSEDVIEQELELRQFTLDLRGLEGERDGARAALARLLNQRTARAAGFAEVERRLKANLGNDTLRLALLREGPTRSERGAITLTAPCRGSVVRLAVKARGAVVQQGDVVSEVACATGQVRADVAVPQSGVARVRRGQPVKLLYDAFPYERFGVRYGTVQWISPANAPERDPGAFRVVVAPEGRGFLVDGQMRSALPGMTGHAQIVVGSLSILDYALRPMRQLRESLNPPPETGR